MQLEPLRALMMKCHSSMEPCSMLLQRTRTIGGPKLETPWANCMFPRTVFFPIKRIEFLVKAAAVLLLWELEGSKAVIHDRSCSCEHIPRGPRSGRVGGLFVWDFNIDYVVAFFLFQYHPIITVLVAPPSNGWKASTVRWRSPGRVGPQQQRAVVPPYLTCCGASVFVASAFLGAAAAAVPLRMP